MFFTKKLALESLLLCSTINLWSYLTHPRRDLLRWTYDRLTRSKSSEFSNFVKRMTKNRMKYPLRERDLRPVALISLAKPPFFPTNTRFFIYEPYSSLVSRTRLHIFVPDLFNFNASPPNSRANNYGAARVYARGFVRRKWRLASRELHI